MRSGVDQFAIWIVALGSLVATAPAFADAASTAQALFDEGRTLLQSGDYANACAKFAESQRLEPALGTLINLAACHAKQGRTATAWGEFNDVLAAATREGDDARAKEARRQIEALQPRLARIRLVVSEHVAGLEIRLDDTTLGPASLGLAIPVDPGTHRITAKAPGRVAWTQSAKATAGTQTDTLIPRLQRLPSSGPSKGQTATTRPRDTRTDAETSSPASAYLFGGIGILGAGVGTYFGLQAMAKKRESEDECSARGCTQTGADLLGEADSAAWISNAGFGVGIVGLGVATYLFLSDSDTDRSKQGALQIGGTAKHGSWTLDARTVW
ncbi:MAG: hypothetical protein R3B13_20570 [Polyangiaceae bacterium]